MDERVQLCSLVAGDRELVVDVRRVQEILPWMPTTPVEQAPKSVEGMLNLRGTWVPVIDVRKRLGFAETTGSKRPRLVVCRVGPHRLALKVDAVPSVFWVGKQALEPAPVSSAQTPGIIGVCVTEDKMRLLLDVRALLS